MTIDRLIEESKDREGLERQRGTRNTTISSKQIDDSTDRIMDGMEGTLMTDG